MAVPASSHGIYHRLCHVKTTGAKSHTERWSRHWAFASISLFSSVAFPTSVSLTVYVGTRLIPRNFRRHVHHSLHCSKSSISSCVCTRRACEARQTDTFDTCGTNKTAKPITEVLLEFPQAEAFDGMPDAAVRLIQASIARWTSDGSEAEKIVEGLGSWRSALRGRRSVGSVGSVEGTSQSWPPDPLRSELQNVLKDRDFLSLLSNSPGLIDSVLLNILEAAQRMSQSEGAASQNDNSDQNSAFGLQMPALSMDSSSSDTDEVTSGSGEQTLQMTTKSPANPSTNPSNPSPSEELVSATETPMQNSDDSDDSALAENEGQGPGTSSASLAREFSEFLKKLKAEAAEGKKAAEASTAWERRLRSWEDLDRHGDGAMESDTQSATQSDLNYFALYRQLLGTLPELRSLIRKMGRKAGMGKLHFQEAQREDPKEGDGIVRSPQMPAETSGITRSDGSLLLLPSELSLLAYANAKPQRSNSAGAKALHRLRRAEASLLSYERSAWMEEKAKSLDNREFRPAFEKGPLICCVDTSRSMAGKEEAVAKAAVLEILRLAETEKRRCHLFFFSGPTQLEELEIPAPPIPEVAWQGVLDFLSRSFRGTTDLDAPLAASIGRIESYEETEWQTADILFVTDSKVEEPSAKLMEKLEVLRDSGLRIFALIVLQDASSVGMKVLSEICDEARG